MIARKENGIWLATRHFLQNLHYCARIRSVIYVIAEEYESPMSRFKLCEKCRHSGTLPVNVSDECKPLVHGYSSRSLSASYVKGRPRASSRSPRIIASSFVALALTMKASKESSIRRHVTPVSSSNNSRAATKAENVRCRTADSMSLAFCRSSSSRTCLIAKDRAP